MFAYVGSRTTRQRQARGEGLSVYRVDAGGGFERVQLVGDLVNPSYLALSADGRCLYTVHGDQREVSAFAIDPATGRLRWLNTCSTGGLNPVHLALDPAGRHLLVSNHLGGSVVVLPVATDGALQPVVQAVPLDGPLGPHRLEQQQPKPHFNAFDPSGRVVLVPDKGLDRVFSFDFAQGRLSPSAVPVMVAREGAGPRHLAFHPGGGVYVVNELDSTVTACHFDAPTGALVPHQIVPTLPDTFTGNSRAAGIAVHPAGRTLYASNRGHDSIAVFRIDGATGRLAFTGAVPSGGRTPRCIALTPDGQRLVVLNEDSDAIVSFQLDPATGWPMPVGAPVPCGSPVSVVFAA